MTVINNFNLRVYGLWIYKGKVLICHEMHNNFEMTKFPGGGIEKGEGVADALKREFIEELNLEIAVESFFYVNDFLQISAFKKTDQIVSFYYIVEPVSPSDELINRQQFEINNLKFEWMPIKGIDPDEFTFPIDKIVSGKLRLLV